MALPIVSLPQFVAVGLVVLTAEGPWVRHDSAEPGSACAILVHRIISVTAIRAEEVQPAVNP